MQEIRLLKGNHPSAFDADGNATMCAEEYIAWLAGEKHSDWPDCVSHVLKVFTRSFNDALDDEERQRLRPYLIPQIGTADDGQDEARNFLVVDWIARTHAPAFLEAAGLGEEAERMRGLLPIEGAEQALAALPDIYDVRRRSWAAVVSAAAQDALAGQSDAVLVAVGRVAEESGSTAARNAAEATPLSDRFRGNNAVHAARTAAMDATTIVARTSPNNPWAALGPVVDGLRESAFGLLGRMLDPAGIHDVPQAAELGQEAPQGKAFPNPREEVKT